MEQQNYLLALFSNAVTKQYGCGSINTVRPIQKALFCYNCLNGFDADKNGCAGIAQKFLSMYAIDELAVTKDDLKLKPSMSLEVTSSNPIRI